MIENIKVSVIMSVFNDEKYLKESIESILKQSYKNIEFIIIDDASTDGSYNIISDYAKQDSRIKVLKNKENIGLTKNLNKAFEYSTGKYIARMDSDDISHKHRIKKQVEFLEENKEVSICGTWAYRIDDCKNIDVKLKRPINNNDIKNRMFVGNPLIHPSVMIKREVFEAKQYDENFKNLQDYKLWADMYNRNFHNIPEYYLLYRNNKNGISNQGKKKKELRLAYDSKIKEILLNQILNLNLCKRDIDLYVKTINCLSGFYNKHEAERSLEIIRIIIRHCGYSNIIPLYSRWTRTNKSYFFYKPFISLFGYLCWFIELAEIVFTPIDKIKYEKFWLRAE